MTQVLMDKAEHPKALFVFAHGAGAGMTHEFMQRVTEGLNKESISVLRFNFPYMVKRQQDGKRRPPDRMPKLLECYGEVLAGIDTDLPVFIGGKSMGGRVAATLASQEDIKGTGVICLGYPFHPQKKPENLRLEPLQQTRKPVLILQGEQDIQVSADDARQLKKALPSARLVLLPSVNHVLKAVNGTSRADNLATYGDPYLELAPGVAATVADFIVSNNSCTQADAGKS